LWTQINPLSIVNNVAMYEAQFTQKSLTKSLPPSHKIHISC